MFLTAASPYAVIQFTYKVHLWHLSFECQRISAFLYMNLVKQSRYDNIILAFVVDDHVGIKILYVTPGYIDSVIFAYVVCKCAFCYRIGFCFRYPFQFSVYASKLIKSLFRHIIVIGSYADLCIIRLYEIRMDLCFFHFDRRAFPDLCIRCRDTVPLLRAFAPEF